MELLADRDPEEARKLLDPVLESMMEAVHHYEGTVNQVMGDGIMALFGAPLAHEDHAVRACYAALRMQETVKRYAEEMRRAHGVAVQIRVGLNSGEVVVRAIGSDLRMDYTAVGQTTHLAARMEQLATPGHRPADAETLRLAEGYVEVQSLGPGPRKGLPEPIEIFELTGAGTARTRLQAAALRGLTRFVGRDAEVEHCAGSCSQAGAATARWSPSWARPGWASRGSPTSSPTPSGAGVADPGGLAVSYGRATSYLPVIDLLKGYFKIGDRDDHRGDAREGDGQACSRWTARSSRCCRRCSRCSTCRSRTRPGRTWTHRSAGSARSTRSSACCCAKPGAAAAAGLRGPALDRRRDPGAAGQPRGEPGLGPPAAAGELSARVRAPLGQQDRTTASCASTAAGRERRRAADGAARAATRGWRRSSRCWSKRGNPFFLEETVRTLVETGALVGERGSVPADAAGGGVAGAAPRCRRFWRRASTGCRRRRSGCCRRPR